jgi:hypothetical protein
MPIEIKGEQKKKKSRSNQKKKKKKSLGGYFKNFFLFLCFLKFHLCTQFVRSKAKGDLVWSMRARGEL